MAEYEYKGPGPHVSDEGEITRPGDRREFEADPDWGPWERIEPEEDAPPPPPAPAPAPAPSPLTPPANAGEM